MHTGTLAVICSLLTSLGEGIAPQEASPAVEPKPTRIAVIGVTILTDFQRTSEGDIEANGFEDAVLIIEDGAVKTVLPRQNYRLGANDIAVSGRGRFAIAAPIIFGCSGLTHRRGKRDTYPAVQGAPGAVERNLGGAKGAVVRAC